MISIINRTDNWDLILGDTSEYANYPIVLKTKWNITDKGLVFYFKYLVRDKYQCKNKLDCKETCHEAKKPVAIIKKTLKIVSYFCIY